MKLELAKIDEDHIIRKIMNVTVLVHRRTDRHGNQMVIVIKMELGEGEKSAKFLTRKYCIVILPKTQHCNNFARFSFTSWFIHFFSR